MAQRMPQACPRCGNMLVEKQPFCVRCGLSMEPYLSGRDRQPTAAQNPSGAPSSAPFSQPPEQHYTMAPEAPFPVQTPLPGSYRPPSQEQDTRTPMPPSFAQIPLPGPYSQPSQEQGVRTTMPPQQAVSSLQAQVTTGHQMPVATLTQRPRKRGVGKVGVLLILLLILALLGSAGYLGYRFFLSPAAALTQPAITTTALNTTVTYAGVEITLLNVQQSQSFLDDPHAGTSGMIRVGLQAQNKTAVPLNLVYTTIAHMVLPGGKIAAPTYVQSTIGLAPGGTLMSTLDFAVPLVVKPDQVFLRIGADNEAQMDIPLTQQPDLGKYAPKTAKLSGTFAYAGLDWALVSATSQLSVDGQQASTGMRYVTVTVKVNNALTQTVVTGSAYDYMRLKAGNTTATPVQTTLPVSFEMGANGKTGTVTFLVPQNAPKLTLILLSENPGGFDQATIDFQI